MAGHGGSQLALLCAIISFLCLFSNIEKHPILERPRISEVLILLISGVTAFSVSFLARWLPGANGRFDDDIGYAKVGEQLSLDQPKRPRRFFLPLLLVCIVCRLEVFRSLSLHLQCSQPAVESFLPVLLLGYELLTSRKRRRDAEDTDDDSTHFGSSIFDDVEEWFKKSTFVQLVATPLFTYGAHVALSHHNKTTAVCLASDDRSKVIALQWLSVCLDAIITILAWRCITWARTAKSRLRTLSGLLLSSSTVIALFLLNPAILFYRMSHSFVVKEGFGVDSLYFFDVFVDGLIFSALVISATLFTCESNPLIISGTITAVCGMLNAWHKLRQYGSYEQLTRSDILVPMYTIFLGFTLFMYRNNLTHVGFMHRILIVFVLLATLIGSTVYVFLLDSTMDRHPLDRIIYDTRSAADRWLVQASISQSLPIAVKEYQIRHHGRNPPPNFDAWYDYATRQRSPIIDYFPQIEKDTLPFWGMKPSKIREDIAKLGANRDIGFVRIKGHSVFHDPALEPSNDAIMDDLVEMIKPFVQHLPDMDLPVNLLDRPRVLASWADRHRFFKTAKARKLALLPSRLASREEAPREKSPVAELTPEDKAKPDREVLMNTPKGGNYSLWWDFQRQVGLACPPQSPARSGFYWDTRDFCSSCANPQALGHFLQRIDVSLDLCHQPDLFRLHSFYMSQMPLKPFSALVPVFSRTKTDLFSDILIPLARPLEAEKSEVDDKSFASKNNRLFWRGDVGRDTGTAMPRILRGGHQERLSHLVNNATEPGMSDAAVTMCLAKANNKERFAYEAVPLREANSALPFDAGIADYSACAGAGCDEARAEFGLQPGDDEDARGRMGSRYVLVADGDEGPPRDALRVVRSTSVPLVASVFREWFTERLLPWVHFVPVDVRWHALHSTLAYFVGLKGRGAVNGRDVDMVARIEDGKWIAEQGRRWAHRAIRREDAEVYLFRLLLEWGRVIDDRREALGFVING